MIAAHRIRTFVRREGRLTEAQKRALSDTSGQYLINLEGAATAFGRQTPIHLEIGSGNGENLLHLALRNQNDNYLAVEVHRPGVGQLINGAKALKLQNLRVVCADVFDLIAVLADESLARVYIFFPDPWPKKRHHKRRLLQAGFMELLRPKLARCGMLYIATDVAEYADSIQDLGASLSGWVNLAGCAGVAARWRNRPRTNFERRGINEGRVIADFLFARCD